MTNHGGKRAGAGRKPYPDFMPEGIVIDVRDCNAYVSRWRREGGRWRLEKAANWPALEDLAIAEIEGLGSAATLSGIYPCSPQLAARAQFEDSLIYPEPGG